MTEAAESPVRTFISYSWSSPTHESWVLGLATRLREDGVDVILDKWDLKPGHDANHFMESMVTDISVAKVLMICDKAYVEKANSRSGGVGTESQIISPEIYKDVRQDKFSAVMTEEDEQGNAHIPIFYKGRIFFDFRSEDRSEAAYEQLLRWIVDKPLHIKPKLGQVPTEILTSQPVPNGTQSYARRVEQAIRDGKASAPVLLREFGDMMVRELRALRPKFDEGQKIDEAVLAATSSMRPYLRQLVDITTLSVRYAENERLWDQILSILEQLGTLMFRDPDMQQWHSLQFDANILIAHEAFLSIAAIALDENRFDFVNSLFERSYLVRDNDGAERASTSDFTVFRQYPRSLEVRERESRRISLQADLVHKAHPIGSVPSFNSLMQADFIAYIRAEDSNINNNWYPVTLLYAADSFRPMPLFARAESRSFLYKLLPALGLFDETALRERITVLNSSGRSNKMFDHHGLPVAYLANAKHLATRP